MARLTYKLSAMPFVIAMGGLLSACSQADTRYDIPEEILNFPEIGMRGVVTAAKLPTPTHPYLLAGMDVWDGTCRVCHGAGIAGAPKITSNKLWSERLEQDLDTLFAHAIDGFQPYAGGNMPAKGGNLDLTDDQVKSAVRYMVFNSGGADMVIENLKSLDGTP